MIRLKLLPKPVLYNNKPLCANKIKNLKEHEQIEHKHESCNWGSGTCNWLIERSWAARGSSFEKEDAVKT